MTQEEKKKLSRVEIATGIDALLFQSTGHMEKGTDRIVAPTHALKISPIPSRVTLLCTRPLVVLYPEFATPSECSHIINLATPLLQNSRTGNAVESSTVSKVRTSSSAFLVGCEDDQIVRRIIARAAEIIGVPVTHFEKPQVVKYTPGQFYLAHYDCNGPHNPKTLAFGKARGFQRAHTILVYLSDSACQKPDEHSNSNEGCTHFPLLSLMVSPRQGAGLYWRNTDGELNRIDQTLHQGLAPCCGVKWAMNLWVHNRPLGPPFGQYLKDVAVAIQDE